MGIRIHSVTRVAEYGSTISSELTDKVLDVIYNAESGWVNENEDEGEIDRTELQEIIDKTKDVELKRALELLLDESDKDYEMVKFVLY